MFSFSLQLKPYVPYNIQDEVVQKELTAQALFNLTYGREVVDKYRNKPDALEGVDPKELVDQSESSN